MSLLQSIHLATVAGQGLHFPDGSTAYLGALSGIVLVRYLSGRTEQWHNEELYDAIKARLPQVQPTQEWREKIIRLIKTATMDELTENALTNGDIHFGLFASDKFPWRMEGFPERVEMNWSNGFKVIARNNRWPLVIVESNGLKFTYENDRLLLDAALKFADRADAARDRTRVVAAIQEILQ